jgi:hypothetical protein
MMKSVFVAIYLLLAAETGEAFPSADGSLMGAVTAPVMGAVTAFGAEQ